MKKILVTGVTGKIGQETLHYLSKNSLGIEVIAAARELQKARERFSIYPDLKLRNFDFEDEKTFDSALSEIDILFLLRPPQISEVKKYFEPLLKSAKANKVQKIVFLSVQGVEKSSVIPHNKIERLIKSLEFDYIFVRPGYFMQNLTTTLLPEIQKKDRLACLREKQNSTG